MIFEEAILLLIRILRAEQRLTYRESTGSLHILQDTKG